MEIDDERQTIWPGIWQPFSAHLTTNKRNRVFAMFLRSKPRTVNKLKSGRVVYFDDKSHPVFNLRVSNLANYIINESQAMGMPKGSIEYIHIGIPCDSLDGEFILAFTDITIVVLIKYEAEEGERIMPIAISSLPAAMLSAVNALLHTASCIAEKSTLRLRWFRTNDASSCIY